MCELLPREDVEVGKPNISLRDGKLIVNREIMEMSWDEAHLEEWCWGAERVVDECFRGKIECPKGTRFGRVANLYGLMCGT